MSSRISAARSAVAACALFAALAAAAQPADATGSQPRPLEFLGEVTFPTGTQFGGTEVGGLSGIDYDAGTGLYYAISDDRSGINAARFYTLKIDLTDGTLDGGDVALNSVVTLLDKNGLPFAPASVDPEAIRYDPIRGSLFWTSEGDANALLPPFVREATVTGAFVRELLTPSKYFPTADKSAGIRNNLAFESLSFEPTGNRIITATENALYQDGPASTVLDRSPSRLLEYGVSGGMPRREFVYTVNKVIQAPDPAGSFSTNGLVEILSLAPHRYLTVERSFSTGRGNVINVYLTDTIWATDVSGLNSITGEKVRPAKKTLIANFATYGIVPDNIEGVTFGPTLPDGRRTLIFVADNNFSPTQTTQFLAFAYKPAH